MTKIPMPGLNLDYRELQQFQDLYSQMTKLFIFCMAKGREGIDRVTDVSGEPMETDRLLSLLRTEQIEEAVIRILGSSSLEEQIIEDTEYPNVKIAAIGVKIGQTPAFCWFVCGVLDDDNEENAVKNFHSTIKPQEFQRSVDLLRNISGRMYTDSYENMLSLAKYSDKQDEEAFSDGAVLPASEKRYKYMTEIVQLLDSDETFDDIAKKAIFETAVFADISNAYLLKLAANDAVEVIASYTRDGEPDLLNDFKAVPIDILHSLGDKPVVVSYNTQIEPNSRAWLEKTGVSALVTMPIIHNRTPIMYVFFADNNEARKWNIDDTKLFGDAVKVLQNIIVRRLQKNSIAGSYKSLEAILDNVGSSIYVRDLETQKILFANRMCYSTFDKEMRNGKLEKLFESGFNSSNPGTCIEVAYPEKSRYYDVNSTLIKWVDGRDVCLYSIFDITEKKIYHKNADIAMYQSKNLGNNKISEYSKEADIENTRRLDMEKALRAAVTDDLSEFLVYYQPIVDVKKPGNPCVGAEALLRFNSTDLGFVMPKEFIPLAEHLGLINPIGKYVLKKACEDLKYWNESGRPYYKVNVNLSVVQLLQNDMADIAEEIIKETGINPKNLTLEVTESLAISDIARMKKILMSIKKLGVKIALDDFGTGYSSLTHIREIPLDIIKVDQTFVTNLSKDEYAKSFISMIGELAKALKVKICVEGIETAAQYNALENMNIHMIQGYYFGKPMKKEEFEEKYILLNEGGLHNE